MSDAPPAGYEMYFGTWNVDVERATDRFVTADSALKFLATTPGTNVWMAETKKHPCAPGDLFEVSALINGDTNAVDVYVAIDWFTSADAYVSTSYIHNGHVTTADTWEKKSGVVTAPATATQWRLIFGKEGIAVAAWIDMIIVRSHPVSFFAQLSASTSYATGSTVVFDDDSTRGYDYGSVYDNTNGHFTAPTSGVYSISTGLQIDALNAGNYGGVVINKNGSNWLQGNVIRAHADGDAVAAVVSVGASLLAAGDYIEILVAHNFGAARDVHGGNAFDYSWFSATRLM